MGKLRSIILLISYAVIAAPACFADEKPDTAPIISALIDVARDTDENVRHAAYEALNTQPRSDELIALYWRGLDDDGPRIQTLSLNKVVELEGPTEKVLKRLMMLAGEPAIPTVDTRRMQSLAVSHLISIGAPAIPALIEALKEEEPSDFVYTALGRIPLGEYRASVTSRLAALLKGENPHVRIVAIQSLQGILQAEAEARQAQAREDRLFEQMLPMFEKMVAKYDRNKDGSLTEDEWNQLAKSPAAADSDRDGRLTPAELGKWSRTSKKVVE